MHYLEKWRWNKKDYIRVSTLQQRTDRQEEQLKNEIDGGVRTH